jgi:DnaJ-class molecular chaperone
MMATAYTTLGVSSSATHEEILAAFRARCAECHPDHAKDDEDRAQRTAKMAKVTLAWRYLGDDEARAKYDRKLADLKQGAPKSADVTPEKETVDIFLQRLRSASATEAGSMAEMFGRSAGLEGASLDRARKAAQKGVELTSNVADLIGLVRGFQR